MSFNIENGGTQVDFNQVITAIKNSHADVVGIQEAWGNTDKIAKALNWPYADAKQHIISRYPIYELKNNNKFVLIEVKTHQFIAMANMHLPDEPYGPDLIKQHIDVSKIIANEKTVRLPTALIYINPLKELLKKGFPVFLTGDFNSPSYLDKILGHSIQWPVTDYLSKAGFTDSYRYIHPNTTQYPGNTWPAKRPLLKHTVDDFNPSTNDLPIRIDFVFSAGNATATNSAVFGENKLMPWPSDHRAVISTFKITPHYFNDSTLSLMKTTTESPQPSHINVSPNKIISGDPISIYWKNATPDKYNYISLQNHDEVRLYLDTKTNGHISYSKNNRQGNYTAWFKTSTASWPLKPGHYQIKLMLDDSVTPLATSWFWILPKNN